MNSKFYKWCAVPMCENTSINTPSKLFVYVPNKKMIRDKWLKLARRDPAAVVTNSSIYFCEDHFDLPNDMENYMEYHLMGSVSKVRMKPGCIPTKFECQPDWEKCTSNTIERKIMALEECDTQVQETSVVTEHLQEIASGSSVQQNLEQAQQDIPKTTDKSIQVHMYKLYRSKATQTKINVVNQMTSTEKPHLQSVSTSPFKITNVNVKPSRPKINLLSMFKKGQQSDSDDSYTPSVARPESWSTSISVQIESTSDCSEMVEDDKKQEALKNLDCTLKKIMKNPRFYIGIPKSCYYLINLIHDQTNIPTNHILMCLKKIRLNNSFRELGDDFSMDPTYASRIFSKKIPIIASVIRPFLVKLDNELIKRNLPMAFRHKYHNVSCIIDCLEIEVQKPSNALNQALSWSDYKKANTIKYLVSSTPNGLVNYISPGYGGRVTDTCLVETCDFIKCIQPGMCVLADRGFKHVEVFLNKEGLTLVRPPSVASGGKLTKAEAKLTKQIASLRIHIERVIRRLREFKMLKPHACVHLNLVKVLDDVITIACGLINIQDSLIK